MVGISRFLAALTLVGYLHAGEQETGQKLADFYAHDPFILAYSPSKTYYLYTAVSSSQNESGRAGV